MQDLRTLLPRLDQDTPGCRGTSLAAWSYRGGGVLVFGPIPSPRFGSFLGVRNVAHGFCSYDCLYCHAGSTRTHVPRRSAFRSVAEVVAQVDEAVAKSAERGERLERLVVAPDGEPCLDLELGALLEALAKHGLPLAVTTNGSLLNRDDVRRDLKRADWVSLKVDGGNETVWRRINRPHDIIRFDTVVQGMRTFAGTFDGFLSTESMLVDGLNTTPHELEATADLCAALRPDMAYLSTPSRPPADLACRPPTSTTLALAETIFSERLSVLVSPNDAAVPASRGDPRTELLALTAAQPMRVSHIHEFLRRAGSSPSVAEELVARGLLCRVEHLGEQFYSRCYEREACELRSCGTCPSPDVEELEAS